MTDSLLHALSVPFATVTGTAAGILALLSWEIFRESPFGTVVALVTAIMSVITIYHVVLLAVGSETLLLRMLRSTAHTVIAVFVLLAVRSHRRLQRADASTE